MDLSPAEHDKEHGARGKTAEAGPVESPTETRDTRRSSVDGDDLTREYHFQAAFAEYLKSHREPGTATNYKLSPMQGDNLLMKAARAMQMAENWRAQAGTWEMLGDALGRSLDAETPLSARSDPYAVRSGRELFRQFHVIGDREWEDMKQCPSQCESACGDRRKQASAYEWAAESAQAS